MSPWIAFVLALTFSVGFGKNEIYKGSKVYKVKFTDPKQEDDLIQVKADVIDIWRRPSYRHNVDGLFMVPPSHFDWFEERLKALGMISDVYINDVFEHIVNLENVNPLTFLTMDSNREFDFNRYYRYNEILQHLNSIEGTSTKEVNVREYGVTEGNHPLVYVEVSRTPKEERSVVIVEAAINPREWITIPAAVNVINNLMEEENDDMLIDFDWIIIPVLNPDGYEYTHTDLRLWQKSVSAKSNLGFICPGVNINRNFDIDWSISDSSSSPCSHLYSGNEPFSEIESQLIRDLSIQYKDRIKLYLSLQNNGGFVSYPWTYERAASGMFIQNHLLAMKMIETWNETGYFIDSGSLALGDRASGTSTDYMRRSGVPYALNVDIKPDEIGGVMIPEQQIAYIVESVWRAIRVAVTEMG